MPGRILIVDDEAHIRKVLELKIKGAGYELRSFSNARAAYDAAAEFEPDVIVTDFRMPGEMNGLELVRKIRGSEALAKTPIILLTGSVAVMRKLKEQLIDVGILEFMAKPFSPRNLIHKIEEFMAALREPSEGRLS